MKAFFVAVLLLFSLSLGNANSGSDLKSTAFERHFNEITYVDVFIDNERRTTHASAKILIESGQLAVPFLVKKISNTSVSRVKSIGLLQAPKKGELALYLLMEIHKIPAEQWPFPPKYDAKKSSLFAPSELKGGPLLINEYFQAKQGPKKLQNIWEIYLKNN